MGIQPDTPRKHEGTGNMRRAPVQGGELEYDVEGDGDPVLLIHGSHVAGAFLPLMATPALEDYRLIRYHRRGFAGSIKHDGAFSIDHQARDAEAILEHLDVDTAHVVGHSYGGATALQMAFEAPERVHSLTLLEPVLLTVPSAAAFVENTMAPAMERYGAGDPTGAVGAFMQEVVGPEWRKTVEQTVPGGSEQAIRDATTFFEVEVPALESWSFDPEKLSMISQPVLYVQGSETLPMFQEIRNLLHERLPQMEGYVVEGATHALQMEKPDAVVEGISGFLKRHPIDASDGQ